MRFLVISALMACAAAAPSHLLAPVAIAGIPAGPVAYSATIPTLSPGDLQAAAIDAQVKAQDLAIAAADKARELTEQASENLKEKIEDGSDSIKETNEETFWSVQDKQWQALDALKTAEAQLDGALANNAPVIAKNAVLGPYVAAVAPLSPISPILYTPGIIAPVKTEDGPAKVEEAKPEVKAITEATEGKETEKESVAIESAKDNLEAKPQLARLVAAVPAIQPFGYPIVAPVGLSPVPLAHVINYGVYPQVGLTPTIVKSGGW